MTHITLRPALTLAGFLLVVLGAVAMPPAATPDVKVIANPSVNVSMVSVEELRGILLATRTSLADSGRLEPVLLKAGPIHEQFIRQITGKTASGLDSYYRSLVFTGKGGMPKMFESEADLVAYVRITRGAIGYVSAAAAIDGVKVLEVR